MQRAQSATRVTAISQGVRLLLKFDLMNGRKAAIHWTDTASAGLAAGRSTLHADRIFICDGPVCTAASASASIDMFLTIIAVDISAEIARSIARRMTLNEIRNSGMRQLSPFIDQFSSNAKFDDMHAFIRMHLTQDYTTDVLAELCGMSPRSFLRHYKDTFGTSPARAVNEIRTKIAADLLTHGKMSPQRVARICGFGSEDTMRRGFSRLFGASPKVIRALGTTAASLAQPPDAETGRPPAVSGRGDKRSGRRAGG